MFNLSKKKYLDIKVRVERLYKRYEKYDTLSKGQVTSKILDDLDGQFFDDPITEVAAFACLSALNKDNTEVQNYLKREFESWKESYELDTSKLDKEVREALRFLNKQLTHRKAAVTY